MATRRRTLSDQLRQAIKASDLSRYAICKATGIDQGSMSHFMARQGGFSLPSVEKLVGFLDLELRPRRKGR